MNFRRRLINHMKLFENDPRGFISKPHYDGGSSIALGYGFDLLSRDTAEINRYLTAVGLPELTDRQVALLATAEKNISRENLELVAEQLNLTIPEYKASNLLDLMIEKEYLPKLKSNLTYEGKVIDFDKLPIGIQDAIIDSTYNIGNFLQKSENFKKALYNAQNDSANAHLYWLDAFIELRYFTNAERTSSNGPGIQERRNGASDFIWQDLISMGLNADQLKQLLDRFNSRKEEIFKQIDKDFLKNYEADFEELFRFFDLAREMLIDGLFELGDLTDKIALAYNRISQAMTQRRDPLVLDLNGDGINSVSIDKGILFDHDGDGIKHATGWVDVQDGFLVYDRNQNGSIDSGAELFGDNSFNDWPADARPKDGFEALKC